MTPTPIAPSRPRRLAFTLVELLVVIGIIALLISILLPTLNRARESAKSLSCLSNQRQVATGVIMFHEDRGYTPTLTDDAIVERIDPRGSVWKTRDDPTDPDDGKTLLDPYSQILPYLGDDGSTTFLESENFSKVFLCASDPANPDPDVGGVFPPIDGYFSPAGTFNEAIPASYGFNADIMTNISDGQSWIGLAQLGVINGPSSAYGSETLVGHGAGAKLVKVEEAAKTVLLGDCGTLQTSDELANGSYQDKPNMLAYMSNYMHYNGGDPEYWGTLAGKLQTGWLAWKLPLDRHGEGENARWQNTAAANKGKLNMAFVDGHATSVDYSNQDNVGDTARVKITPWLLPEVGTGSSD